jgi:hypothetical protein
MKVPSLLELVVYQGKFHSCPYTMWWILGVCYTIMHCFSQVFFNINYVIFKKINRD